MAFNRAHPNETSYKGKLVLRCLALFLITVALLPAAYSWRISIFILPVIVMSWLWNLINIVKRVRSEYPIHPGANVACDLIIWFLFLILGSLNLVSAVFANVLTSDNWKSSATFSSKWGNLETCSSKTSISGDDETKTTSSTCSIPPEQIDLVRRLAKASLVGVAFAGVVGLLHFVLFIWACVDTHRYRRDRRERIAAFRAKQNEFSTEQ